MAEVEKICGLYENNLLALTTFMNEVDISVIDLFLQKKIMCMFSSTVNTDRLIDFLGFAEELVKNH